MAPEIGDIISSEVLGALLWIGKNPIAARTAGHDKVDFVGDPSKVAQIQPKDPQALQDLVERVLEQKRPLFERDRPRVLSLHDAAISIEPRPPKQWSRICQTAPDLKSGEGEPKDYPGRTRYNTLVSFNGQSCTTDTLLYMAINLDLGRLTVDIRAPQFRAASPSGKKFYDIVTGPWANKFTEKQRSRARDELIALVRNENLGLFRDKSNWLDLEDIYYTLFRSFPQVRYTIWQLLVCNHGHSKPAPAILEQDGVERLAVTRPDQTEVSLSAIWVEDNALVPPASVKRQVDATSTSSGQTDDRSAKWKDQSRSVHPPSTEYDSRSLAQLVQDQFLPWKTYKQQCPFMEEHDQCHWRDIPTVLDELPKTMVVMLGGTPTAFNKAACKARRVFEEFTVSYYCATVSDPLKGLEEKVASYKPVGYCVYANGDHYFLRMLGHNPARAEWVYTNDLFNFDSRIASGGMLTSSKVKNNNDWYNTVRKTESIRCVIFRRTS